MSYNAYVTTIKQIRPHSNSDQGLQVATVFGNDVIVKNIQEGNLVIYFPTDGRLGVEYATENNLVRIKDENGNNIGGYLDPDKRHISTLKLRGEKSDGLIMPLSSLAKFTDISKLKEGDMISVLNGVVICEKYIPYRKQSNGANAVKNKAGKKVEDTVAFPFFEQHIDTSQFAYNTQKFKEGDICYITLKLHGTSQRTSHTIKEEKKQGFFSKLFGRKPSKVKSWEYVTGTRRVTLKGFDGGFYGDNMFRKQWHDMFTGRLQKGESVYYEVVGYTDNGGLIMPECNNEKTKDKEFVKQYGKTTQFTYGCPVGQSDVYVYRMTFTNEDGYVVEYPTELVQLRCEQMGVKFVTIFDKFIYTTHEDLIARVDKFTSGIDPVGKTHIREGVIVRIDNKEKFTAFKNKSFEFKVLEGIVKADDVLDMEEAESINE